MNKENKMKKKSKVTKEKEKKLLDEKEKFRDVMKEVKPFLPEKSHILKRQSGEWNVNMSLLTNLGAQNTDDAGNNSL